MAPFIFSPGTQVVSLKQVAGQGERIAHPAGAVGVIVKSPTDASHAYRVRFADGFEARLHHDQLQLLTEYKLGPMADGRPNADSGLGDRVFGAVSYTHLTLPTNREV